MTTIDRQTAIARMAKGEPCETWHDNGEGWQPTIWSEFGYPAFTKFRIPPEPRRGGAREFWIVHHPSQDTVWKNPPTQTECTHVREVLPGDVVCERMTEAEIRTIALRKQPSFIGDSVDYQTGAVTFARALGLIREEGAT